MSHCGGSRRGPGSAGAQGRDDGRGGCQRDMATALVGVALVTELVDAVGPQQGLGEGAVGVVAIRAGDLALVDDDAVARHADDRRVGDEAVENSTTGDRAHLRDLEGLLQVSFLFALVSFPLYFFPSRFPNN